MSFMKFPSWWDHWSDRSEVVMPVMWVSRPGLMSVSLPNRACRSMLLFHRGSCSQPSSSQLSLLSIWWLILMLIVVVASTLSNKSGACASKLAGNAGWIAFRTIFTSQWLISLCALFFQLEGRIVDRSEHPMAETPKPCEGWVGHEVYMIEEIIVELRLKLRYKDLGAIISRNLCWN